MLGTAIHFIDVLYRVTSDNVLKESGRLRKWLPLSLCDRDLLDYDVDRPTQHAPECLVEQSNAHVSCNRHAMVTLRRKKVVQLVVVCSNTWIKSSRPASISCLSRTTKSRKGRVPFLLSMHHLRHLAAPMGWCVSFLG